jgi:glutaminyl-peptide cyclotransferase
VSSKAKKTKSGSRPMDRGLADPAEAPRSRWACHALYLAVAAVIGGAVLAYSLFMGGNGAENHAAAATTRLRLEDIPFNGARAYEYLKQLCAIGPRPSGSPGMAAQQKFLAEHFQKLGGQVEWQKFRGRHPQEPTWVPMANMIVHWHPESKRRILLCAHYDTLPYPMLDPVNPRGTFVGANDNASGVAVLMELAQEIPKLKLNYGVDFVFFDAEEFIFRDGDRFFLGSEYFARQYVAKPPPYRYRWGVLLDMIGDADLQIYQERHSLYWRDTRPLVKEVWATARRLGVSEFIHRRHPRVAVLDDHVPLHNTGKISCIDVIDYDYPPWHTQGDTPDKCSALSLAKVGWVVREWLEAAQ